MSEPLQKEDGILQFCYETEIGCGSFDELVKRIKWNYEAKFDKRPQEGCPVSSCGPFGDHGYIEPFLDFSVYFHTAAAAAHTTAERIFSNPKRSGFTRYFNACVPPQPNLGQTRASSSSHACCNFTAASSSRMGVEVNKASCSSWLDSIIDTALLELDDLLDEMDLCCRDWNQSPCHDDGERQRNTSDLTAYEVAIRSLQARLSDDQFFTYSKTKRSSVQNYCADDSCCCCVDYDHLPWPWISLPPSNDMQMRIFLWNYYNKDHDEDGGSKSDDHHHHDDFRDLDSSDGRNSSNSSEDFSCCSSSRRHMSPLHHSSPVSNSSLTSPKDAAYVFSATVSSDGNVSSINLRLEARPIPVLSPLGLHRAEGGGRILSGAGVDHMNLIQLIGNPAHGFQPKLVQSWRNPTYVQWVSQWNELAINSGL